MPARLPTLDMNASDEKALTALLDRYQCPTALPAIRTILMGNIASPILGVSPLAPVQMLWNGAMPEFESEEDVQTLVNALIGTLWNRLAEHQNSRNPFRLTRTPVEPTRAALQALASTRKLEISGFVDGLFGNEDQLDLPVKAQQALDVLIEAHSMFAGAANLLADTTKEASEQGLREFARNSQKMTEIAEQQINKTIQACKRARAHALEPMAQDPTHRPDFVGDLDDEPDFVESPLSQALTRNGTTVQVEIYADEDGKWILEVIDRQQTSHVWDEHFDTDQQALAEAIRALEEEPMDFMTKPESARDIH
jgi:hypothetical protein